MEILWFAFQSHFTYSKSMIGSRLRVKKIDGGCKSLCKRSQHSLLSIACNILISEKHNANVKRKTPKLV